MVLARVGDAAAADDVMQEVAMAAVEKGHQLRDPASVAPWLYRLAVVAALQYRRRQGRGRKLIDRFAERHPPTEADTREPDPLDWLLADERKKLVRQALGQLAATRRRNPAAEIHRGLVVPPVGRTFGIEHERRGGAAAPGTTENAASIGPARSQPGDDDKIR